jgi:hypothetical protein
LRRGAGPGCSGRERADGWGHPMVGPIRQWNKEIEREWQVGTVGFEITRKFFQFECQTESKLFHSKSDLTGLKKFEIKYEWKVLKIRNSFSYGNLLRFRLYFEWKFREASMGWISMKIHRKNLEL